MKIWTLWLQGREAAPDMVRNNFDLWERLNPGHQVSVLDRDDVGDLLAGSGIDLEAVTPQVASNLTRLELLRRHGGLWVDSTLLPVWPLDDWFTGELDTAGFFAFHRKANAGPVSNWLLYGEAGHPLIAAWHDEMFDYFSRPRRLIVREGPDAIRDPVFLFRWRVLWRLRRLGLDSRRKQLWHAYPGLGREVEYYPYFIMHQLFDYMVSENPELERLWRATPQRSSALPLVLSISARTQFATEEEFDDAIPALVRVAPVHKINWRFSALTRVGDYVRDNLAALQPVRE